MIDLDMIMESAEWNSLRGFGWQKSCVTYDEVRQMITRLRQAEKDAARYRWLRDESWGCDKAQPLPKVMSGRRYQEIVLAEKAMDAAIDEAMQCK